MLIHFDPGSPPLILHPVEIIHKNYKCSICTEIFIATLSIIAPNGKQPQCSTIGELLSKLWYRNSTDYYAAV